MEHFSDRVLASGIREAAVLAECPGVGRSIFEYRRGSRSAQEFKSLAEELIEKKVA